MDNSETYIKMCEKAVEIQGVQKEFPLPVGGYYTDGETLFCGCDIHSVGIDYETEEFIWLPRQDQLQEMIKKGNETAHELNARLYRFSSKNSSILTINYSMEQLWLAFVMKEKFNKTWNGEEWVDNGKE